MPINFKCSKCGKPIAVPDKMAGRTGKCPACQSPLTVPTGTAAAAAKKAPSGGVPASALKTQLALDADPRVATALGKTKKPAAKASPKKRELDSDGDQTIIDDGMLAAKRSAMHEPETYEVPPLVDDDADAGDEGFPDVIDDDDDADDEDDADDNAAGVPSAQEVLERARAKAAQRRGDGDGGSDSSSAGARNRRFEQTAGQKKGGGFLWVVFGLLLAISHTAAAAIFGVWLAAAYMKTPGEYAFMAPLIEILGLNDTIAPKTTATPTASPESNAGPPSETEAE